MDTDEALRLCREVRKDLNEMLADLRSRIFYDVASDVGELAKGGWAFEKMDVDLGVLEKHLMREDLIAIDKKEWSICELVNFYDSLAWSMHRHSPNKDSKKLEKDAERWRDTAGAFAQTVYQLECSD
jgi:hypothetical protein